MPRARGFARRCIRPKQCAGVTVFGAKQAAARAIFHHDVPKSRVARNRPGHDNVPLRIDRQPVRVVVSLSPTRSQPNQVAVRIVFRHKKIVFTTQRGRCPTEVRVLTLVMPRRKNIPSHIRNNRITAVYAAATTRTSPKNFACRIAFCDEEIHRPRPGDFRVSKFRGPIEFPREEDIALRIDVNGPRFVVVDATG